MRISLCSGASVRGFCLLCTDAAVFIVFGLIWCSVGAHIGDSVYRRDMGPDGICGSGPVSGFRSVECSGKTGGEKGRSEGARAKVDSRRFIDELFVSMNFFIEYYDLTKREFETCYSCISYLEGLAENFGQEDFSKEIRERIDSLLAV